MLKVAKVIMLVATVYNVIWGAVTLVYPEWLLFENEGTPFTLILIRCIGMLVGVYGIAYYFCSVDPIRYWPLIFTGLVGKVLGPIGSCFYIFTDVLASDFLLVNVFNDLIWIVPFSWILVKVFKKQLI